MRLLRLTFLLISAVFVSGAHAQDVETNGNVCGDPISPCNHTKWKFPSNDLSFQLPVNLKWQTNYRSAFFYAVVLQSRKAIHASDVDSPCGGYFTETERRKVQALFPARKVFASRFGCADPGVGYTNVNFDFNLMAVYGGGSQQEASQVLKIAKAKGFKDANIRRMQVVLGFGD